VFAKLQGSTCALPRDQKCVVVGSIILFAYSF
jgi:hypothetical protein